MSKFNFSNSKMSESKTESKKIVFQVTGSIAAFKAAMVISQLTQKGFEVIPVASPAALEFVGRKTLEGLTGQRLRSNLLPEDSEMEHISLTRSADLFILYPATANTLNRLVAGLADDWIGSLFLANNFKKPYWIAPAMNTQMYLHPATQASLRQLTSWGAKIFETSEGRLACGEEGVGRLVEPQVLVGEIETYFEMGAK